MLSSNKPASQEGIQTTKRAASSSPHLSPTAPLVLRTSAPLLSHFSSPDKRCGDLYTAKETVVYEKRPPSRYNKDLAKDKEKFQKRFFKHPLVSFIPYSLLHALPTDDGDNGILEINQLVAVSSCESVQIQNQAVAPIIPPSSIAYSEPLKIRSSERLPLIAKSEPEVTAPEVTAAAANKIAVKTDVPEEHVKRKFTLRDMDSESSKPTADLQLQSIKMRDMIIVRRRLSRELGLRRAALSRSLSRSPRQQRGILPRPTSVEGVDGVAAGAATSAAACRLQRQSNLDLSNINPILVRQAKEKVEEAIKKNKIFAIIGPYHHIREGLKRRGWVEKFYRATINVNGDPRPRLTSRSAETPTCLSDDADGDGNDDDQTDFIIAEPERKEFPWEADGGIYGVMARSLKAICPNFIWTLKKSQIDFRFLRKDQIVNHHTKAPFTTKVGLCRHLRMVRWFDDIGSEYFFPRCYLLSANEEKRAFIDDYQLTAAMAAIKWACNYYEQPRQPNKRVQLTNVKEIDDETSTYDPQVWNAQAEGSITDSSSGTISATKAISMALRHCDWYLRSIRHEDLDESSTTSFSPTEWNQFVQFFYGTAKEPSPFEEGEPIYQRCQFLCDKINAVNPQFELDGCRNIWIVKPGAKSRGRGITCHRKLDSILALLSNNISSLDNRFVVQKYIEKPLLIFNTKFDIRQWFIVTDWNPLTVWWYQDCYLRFCSHEFTLDHFSEAAHLSNNAISHKYTNGPRSPLLPSENMWYLDEFKQYLLANGQGKTWERDILPGMRKAIINALLCAQESIDPRKHSFELYGADFMISEDDLRPWLIEINASPCMAPSTSVTMDLTAKVLEDTLKVILDRRTDKNCDTGRFEMIYKQQLPPKTIFNGVDLTVSGTRMSSVTSAESSQPTTRAPSVRRQQTPSTNFTEPRSVEPASPFTGGGIEGKTPIPPVVGQRTPQKYTNSPSLRITGTSTAYQEAATGIQERIHMSGESTAAHRSSQPSASLQRKSTASEDHLKSWGVGSGSSEPRKSGALSRGKTVAQPKLMATYARSTSRDEKRVLPRNVSCPPKCPVTGAGQAGDSNERSVARVHVASRLQPVIPPSTVYRSPAGIELRVPKTENLMRSIVDFHKTKYQRAGESDSPVLCLHNSNANNSESPSSKEPEKKTSNQKPVVCSRESCEDIVDSDSLHQDLTSMGFAVLKSPLQSVTCVKTASSRKKLPKTLPISKQPQPRKFDNSSPTSYKILKMRPQAVAGEISTIRAAVRLRAK